MVHLDEIEQDCHLTNRPWVSRWYIFIITLNVRILPTMQVILIFEWHYHFSRSFLLLKWFILMRLNSTCHLTNSHWVSRWYIFIITLNVRILPTMQVILIFEWHYHFSRSFLLLKWFILMRLNRTWHLISRHWVSRWYIFIITLNVRILLTMHVILNFDWHYQFNRSFLLLEWFILMRLNRIWNLITRHWVSKWYILIITLMSGFYWQCRWYWTLTDTVNSVDRFCFWNGSPWLDWSELDTWLAAIESLDGIYSLSR